MNMEAEHLSRLYQDIRDCVQTIKNEPLQENLDALGNALDKFFTDSKCLRVLYTPNVDKLFFGIYAFPKISGEEVVDILFKGSRYMVKEYWLELDSRLFTGFMLLTADEITALIVHDVASLVNNSAPAAVVKKEIDNYLVKNNEVLKVSDSVHYRGMLAYGFADAMRKYTTIFEQDTFDENNNITDEFLDQITDYSLYIRNAVLKINQVWGNINKEVKNKFITMSWVLRLYKDVRHNRIPGLQGIKRCIELSPSKIEQRELKNFGKRFTRIDDDSLLESAQYDDPTNDKKILKQLRESITERPRHTYSSASLLECVRDDIDNILLSTNIEVSDEDMANTLLHNMNKKMALIQDYVTGDEAISPPEFKQWENIFNHCEQVRKDLSSGLLYNEGRRMINTYRRAIDQ